MSSSAPPPSETLPRIPGGLIVRPRLLGLLDRLAPLTVVKGACGAGKTVAIRAWAESIDHRVLWFTADPAQRDSSSLARAMLRHCGRSCPNGTWRDLRQALTSIDGMTTIVVDDAALLEPTALLDLCEVVASVPTLHLIAATNRDTVLDNDGVTLLLDRTTIGPEELMFDEDELRRILDVGPQTAQEVLTATNGFPAVIHALAKRRLPGRPRALEVSAAEAVEDYMRFRVRRSGYDPDLLATLARASLIDPLDAGLARDLSDEASARKALDEAARYGLGCWSTDPAGAQIFRFAPFARVLLRRELERSHRGEIPRLRKTAAVWLLRQRRPAEALQLAIEAEDMALAEDVVRRSWFELGNQGRAVRRILKNVPTSQLRRAPLTMILLAGCYSSLTARRARGMQLLRIALGVLRSHRPSGTGADHLVRRVFESGALRLLGMHDQAALVAEDAFALLPRIPEMEHEEFAEQVPEMCSQLGISLYYGGMVRRSIECFSYGAAVSGSSHQHAINCLSMLSGIHALAGDLPEARHFVTLVRGGNWTRGHLARAHGVFYHAAEAILALEDSDVARAADHVAAFAPNRATSEHWVEMAIVEALVSLSRGQPVFGRTQLESFVALRGREGGGERTRRSLGRVRTLLALADGRTEEARSLLRRDGHDQGFETAVARARLALIEDRPRQAIRLIGSSQSAAASSRLRAEAAAIRIAAMLRTGSAGVAAHDVQELGALLCDRGLRSPLALLAPPDAAAVQDALRSATPCRIEEIRSVLREPPDAQPLSDRELVVLQRLPSHKPLTEIAAELGVSYNTVKTQVRSIYRKLEVATREEAIAVADARYLLSAPG